MTFIIKKIVIQWYKRECFPLREKHPLVFKKKNVIDIKNLYYVNYKKKGGYTMIIKRMLLIKWET